MSAPSTPVPQAWWQSRPAEIVAWGLSIFLVLLGMGSCKRLGSSFDPLPPLSEPVLSVK